MSTSLTPLTLTLWGLAGCSIVMLLAWIVALKLNFLSLVDAVWAFGIAFWAIAYQITFGATLLRSIFAFVIILIWSFRLGSHLLFRLSAHYPIEDSRYVKLKSAWKQGGGGFLGKSFLFFQFQAFTQAFFAYPFAVAALDESQFPRTTEIAGVLIALVGIVGESIADAQLMRFKKEPSNKGKVCNAGLWRYSRHPNYFFEWIIWCGFGTFALGAPWGGFALLCPLLMLLLLLFVTGVAPSEEQSLKSRGDAYIQYQRTTSCFVPWFSKKEAE